MTLHDRFAAAVTRIATATSISRQRAAEHDRAQRRGHPDELTTRLERAVEALETCATEMEKALT